MAYSDDAGKTFTEPQAMALPSGGTRCFDPTLWIDPQGPYFCSKSENEQTWYRDFDLRTQSFDENIHKAKLKTAAGIFDMQPRHFHADAAAQGFTKPPVNHGLYTLSSTEH